MPFSRPRADKAFALIGTPLPTDPAVCRFNHPHRATLTKGFRVWWLRIYWTP